MRRDLIIAILISALMHGGVFGSSYLKLAPKAKKAVVEEPTIELMKMPDLEPDEPEPLDPDEPPPEKIEFVPPTQADVPQVVPPDAFVQQLQPPPPEGIKPSAGVIAIPKGIVGGLGKGVQVFDIKDLDQPPVVRANAPVQYPFEMKRAGVEGEVVVEFIVDMEGNVRNPFVVRSTQREFDQPALQSIVKWKFKPGRKGGKNVNTSRVQLPIKFTINE
jgi:protein TonB